MSLRHPVPHDMSMLDMMYQRVIFHHTYERVISHHTYERVMSYHTYE